MSRESGDLGSGFDSFLALEEVSLIRGHLLWPGPGKLRYRLGSDQPSADTYFCFGLLSVLEEGR
jgi:hypothetical protein